MSHRPQHSARRGIAVELLLLAAVLAVATALAELLGAVNTGTALFFGQMAFAATVVWIMLRRP